MAFLMADGFTHSAATAGLVAGVGTGYVISSLVSPEHVPWILLGAAAGLVLSPDMDVDGGWIGHYWIRKVLGRPGEWYFNTIVTPYQKSFKHRSFWSHFPLISTALRLIYFVFPFITLFLHDQDINEAEISLRSAIAFFCMAPFLGLLIALEPSGEVMMAVVGGLALSDFLHWLFDIF